MMEVEIQGEGVPPPENAPIGEAGRLRRAGNSAADAVPREAIVEIRQDWGTLPLRRASREPVPASERLTRIIGSISPAAIEPVSCIGFEAALGAMAEATRQAIASDLVCYAQWCASEKRRPLPADAEDLVRYLRALDARGMALATLARRIASLSAAHRMLGIAAQTTAPMVRDTLRGIRRRRGATQRQAAPIRFAPDDGGEGRFTLTALLAACGGDLQGLRDAALISVAYDAGLRVSELTAAQVADIEPQADRAGLLAIPRSKTDQEGEGAWAWLSPDTLRRIEAWRGASGIGEGPLFRRVGVDRRHARAAVAPVPYHAIPGHTRHWQRRLEGTPASAGRLRYTVGSRPLTRQGVNAIYRRLALAAYDAGEVAIPVEHLDAAVRALSTHSMRVGLTQDLFAAGEDGSGIALALRWSSPATALRYGRKLQVKGNAAARVVGRLRG